MHACECLFTWKRSSVLAASRASEGDSTPAAISAYSVNSKKRSQPATSIVPQSMAATAVLFASPDAYECTHAHTLELKTQSTQTQVCGKSRTLSSADSSQSFNSISCSFTATRVASGCTNTTFTISVSSRFVCSLTEKRFSNWFRQALVTVTHTTNYTLHTTHYTLHTTHYTLHTKHYTLHTTHCTLHTTQYTHNDRTTHPLDDGAESFLLHFTQARFCRRIGKEAHRIRREKLHTIVNCLLARAWHDVNGSRRLSVCA